MEVGKKILIFFFYIYAPSSVSRIFVQNIQQVQFQLNERSQFDDVI